jgi:hypothetical protein
MKNNAEAILKMIKENAVTEDKDITLKKFLSNLEDTPGPSIDDVVETNFSTEDIMHYLHTEQDPRRMAKWCRMFLELDY